MKRIAVTLLAWSLFNSVALADPAQADLRSPLEELLRLHYRLRFDPRGLSGKEREMLTREAKRCLEKLAS